MVSVLVTALSSVSGISIAVISSFKQSPIFCKVLHKHRFNQLDITMCRRLHSRIGYLLCSRLYSIVILCCIGLIQRVIMKAAFRNPYLSSTNFLSVTFFFLSLPLPLTFPFSLSKNPLFLSPRFRYKMPIFYTKLYNLSDKQSEHFFSPDNSSYLS